MDKIISATKVVRDFSTILNKIKFGGDHYIIKRNGKLVARMSPVDEHKPAHSLKDLKKLLDDLPRLGEELHSFSADLEKISNEQPETPDELNWE